MNRLNIINLLTITLQKQKIEQKNKNKKEKMTQKKSKKGTLKIYPLTKKTLPPEIHYDIEDGGDSKHK